MFVGLFICWRTAFTQAEGRRDEAHEALHEALEGDDLAAARPLLDAALVDRDYASLEAAPSRRPPRV